MSKIALKTWLKERLANKKIAVIGLGVEGLNTLAHLKAAGLEIYSVGDKFEKEVSQYTSNTFFKDQWLDGVKGADVIIRSPGIHPDQEAFKNFIPGKTLLGQVDLTLEFAREKCIGITGTLGKGSCISQLSHILTKANYSHLIGGNFGIPAFDLCEADPDWYLLELSSFQLATVLYSPRYAALLQTTSEHLDWHSDTLDYQNAKGRMVQFQTGEDFVFYQSKYQATKRLAMLSSAKSFDLNDPHGEIYKKENSLFIKGKELKAEDCEGLGLYQMENRVIAAAIAYQLGIDVLTLIEGCKTWPGLALRMEKVGEQNDVIFINDSYATRPEATQGAVNSLKIPFSLILGGSEKFADFNELAIDLKKQEFLQKIVLMGSTKKRLAQILDEHKVLYELAIDQDLIKQNDEVADAFEKAFKPIADLNTKSAILFSPACASFGLFENYKQRGSVFNEWVKNKIIEIQTEAG